MGDCARRLNQSRSRVARVTGYYAARYLSVQLVDGVAGTALYLFQPASARRARSVEVGFRLSQLPEPFRIFQRS